MTKTVEVGMPAEQPRYGLTPLPLSTIPRSSRGQGQSSNPPLNADSLGLVLLVGGEVMCWNLLTNDTGRNSVCQRSIGDIMQHYRAGANHHIAANVHPFLDH